METKKEIINLLLTGTGIVIAGCLLPANQQIGASILSGVGSSIIASAICYYLVSKRFAGLNLALEYEAVIRQSPFLRKHQKVIIYLREDENGNIKVFAEHSFTLKNTLGRTQTKSFNMYTDLGGWNMDGGFISVQENGKTTLEGASLKLHLDKVNNKEYFRKEYKMAAEAEMSFRFTTFGYFRKRDRLIWTVQDISEGFDIEVRNETSMKDEITFKINHHEEREARNSISRMLGQNECEVVRLTIPSAIFPYQGFELSWNFEESALPESVESGMSPLSAEDEALISVN
jgi:hypothetical protein